MTTFYFVRHGEPDYQSVGDWAEIPFGKEFAGLTKTGETQIMDAVVKLRKNSPQLIISSPYTRTMQGAGIIARELNLPIFVELDLHEWESDRTRTVRDSGELLRLCREHDSFNGIYPKNCEKLWESTQLVRERVLKVLEHYLSYERVIVSGHAMMIQAVTGEYRPFAYGEIVTRSWEDILQESVEADMAR